MRGPTLAILSAILFGITFLAIRIIDSTVPSPSVSFLRVFGGFLIIALVTRLKSRFSIPEKRDLIDYAIIGILLTLVMLMFNYALVIAPLADMTLLDQMITPSVFLLSLIFLKERANWNELMSLIVALIGIAMINPFRPTSALGSTLVLGQAVIYAGIVVFMRWSEKNHKIDSIFWMMCFASLFLSPFVLIFGLGDIINSLFWIIVMAIFSGLAYLTLSYSLEYIGADLASLLNTIVTPLTAVVLGVLFLSEIPAENVILGGILIIFSGLILRMRFR